MTKRGAYIVIEGTDGTGKSTQAELLVKRLESLGHTVVQFHEPDGIPIAHELRSIIVNGTLERSALTNVLLFTAARRENWLQYGLPALERGEYVVTTRNYFSTLAYQAIAEGLGRGQTAEEDMTYIEALTLQATDKQYVVPDHAFILDIEDEVERARRIEQRGELKTPDTFESRDNNFQQRVIEGYRKIAKLKQIPVISASQSPEAVADQIWQVLSLSDELTLT